jgi:hypothetical protein
MFPRSRSFKVYSYKKIPLEKYYYEGGMSYAKISVEIKMDKCSKPQIDRSRENKNGQVSETSKR